MYIECAFRVPSCTPNAAGVEFDDLSPPQQADAVAGALAVFARVEPSHKTRLVDLLKQQVGDMTAAVRGKGGV